MPPEAPAQQSSQSNDLDGPSKPLNGSPSLYSLRTIPVASAQHSPTSPRLEELAHGPNETTSLLSGSGNQRSYTGLAKYMPALDPDARRLVFRAGLKVLLLFIVGSAVLGGTLWVALPTLDEADRPMLRIPKSFAQLQDLNTLLKKYRDVYPYRIFICYTITYLYLQAFSLPGSMYLSILGGAVWGVPRALPLACSCVATGATLCYLISAALGPALLAVPSWRARLDTWSEKIESQRENLMSYLIVIRIAPFPPHWVVNVLCPHVGIGIPRFWISTFLGIMGVSVIHTTIGGGLDQMTSAEDFHLISWRNFGLLGAVVVAVLIPVGLRWSWKRELEQVADEDEVRLAGGPGLGNKKGKQRGIILLESDDEGEYVSEERTRQGWWQARKDRKMKQREEEEDAALAVL
ncbi:unnamed protein product [Rhizoctonia solani]|uniref:VTT domain-containing protein n=1 Tax=Rhizoctonia solani TaxID=456999 RepID=A0A8H3D9R9_9AGAM|nr:unnamed protein product [Rhizoctonia solani]